MEKYKDNEIVSISLERYESMKEKINKLQKEIQHIKMHLQESNNENNERDEKLELSNKVIKEILKEKYALKHGTWSIEGFIEYGYKYVTDDYDEVYEDVLKKLAIEVYKDVNKESES